MFPGLRLLLLLLSVTLVAACGWHLRGAASMPEGVESVYVEAPSRAMKDSWTMQLSEAGVSVTDRERAADARLVVNRETFDRRVLSVDPDTGKVREYALAYTATVHLKSADGSVLVEPLTVRQSRNFVFDETAVIGAENQEAALHREMRLSAVQQILRQMQVATCARPSGGCSP